MLAARSIQYQTAMPVTDQSQPVLRATRPTISKMDLPFR